MADKKKTNTAKKSTAAKKKPVAKKNTKKKTTTTKKKTTTAKKTTQTKKVTPKKEVKTEVKKEVKKTEPEKELVIPIVTEAGHTINDVKEEIKEIIDLKEEQTNESNKTGKQVAAKPTTILGKELPRDNSESAKKERRLLYAKDALVFAIVVPLIDLIAMTFIESYPALNITSNTGLNYFLTVVTDFVLIFIVTYIIEYIFGERSTK